ncbi:MAG TPA: adenosylcobinamide-GDP ribazoletransferase [Natrialbaceae archaeon]|nr:adenosylcobinamide-GDP ribazoletransferase [Natrialbaceae archaeon]
MVLNAVRGALGFLTRLPVGADEDGWEAFRRTPAAIPVVGYVVGLLAAIPFAAGAIAPLTSLPGPSIALAYLAVLYGLTGITHLDGLADCADAAIVHGDVARRREVAKDETVGVGAAVALGFALVGLVLAALALTDRPPVVAVVLVLVAEVGARTGMAALICLGDAAYDGMGASLTGVNGGRDLIAVGVVAAPVAVVLPGLIAGAPDALSASLGAHASLAPAVVATFLGALAGATLVYAWARSRLGGVSGDVLGAANEVGRLVALHLGVIAWTLS